MTDWKLDLFLARTGNYCAFALTLWLLAVKCEVCNAS